MSSEERLVRAVLAREPTALELPRTDVYRGLVRSNLRGVIKNAFPVSIGVEGEAAFERRIEDFLASRAPSTSLYRDIPEDFVQWALEEALPFADLMHYEWLELVAARHPADIDDLGRDASDEVRLNPTMQFGLYERKVHLLGAELKELPKESAPVIYLVWRRPVTDEIAFHRVGLLLARALAHAQVHGGDEGSLVGHLLMEEPSLDRQEVALRLGETIQQLRERDGVL